jgi:hypothetical protein
VTATGDAVDLTAGEELARTRFTQGLRELADWYDLHPEVPLPHGALQIITAGDEDPVAGLAVIARAMGRCDKKVGEAIFTIRRKFSGVTLEAIAWRQQVCEATVVGERTVTRDVTKVVGSETVTEPVVEWRCLPLLSRETAS